VAAVAEPSAAARTALDGPGLAMHASLEAMLDAGGLDGVLVAAPSGLHLSVLRSLAAAGLPVLCEKPCGTTADEARAALVAARGVPLQVAYWRRFVPALQALRARIAGGELGGLYMVASHQWDGAPPPREFRAGSGGIFVDMGVHEFDQICWLTGQEIVALRTEVPETSGEAPVPGDAESAFALCTLSGGSAGLVSLGRRFPLGDVCRVEVFGTRGAEECRFLWPPDADAVFLAALRAQAEAFAAWIGGAAPQGASGADAVAALAAAEQAGQALRPAQLGSEP
jgi:myo-inositol 2-dehydrogenase/D-chiro-inositol 1-dehydrogenase